MVVLGGVDTPVTEPRELNPSQDNARLVIVKGFRDWTLRNPDSANALSAHALAPSNQENTDPLAGIGCSRRTLLKWFPAAQCGGSVWHALCYAAVHYYKLYDPPSRVPDFVDSCATTYKGWLAKWQTREKQAAVDWHAIADDDMATFISTHSDLNVMTAVVRTRVERLHEKLSTASAFGSVKIRSDDAEANASAISAIADRAIRRVYRERANIERATQKNCVPIIEAAVDAHRLRSRTPGKEGDEFALLLDLRTMGLELTRKVLPEPDVVLNEYHCDMVRALLSHSFDEALEGEITATERLLEHLEVLKVRVQGEALHRGRPRRQTRNPHPTLDADQLVFAIVNIAANLVVHPENDSLHQRAQSCAQRLLKLYKGTRAKPDHTDASELLAAAQHRTIDEMAQPIAALRIVKFRGVGEVLLARRLVHAATVGYSRDEIPVDLRLYLGDKPDRHQARRALLLQRAIGLYKRSSDWLRRRGVSGALREIAAAERKEAESKLRELHHPHTTAQTTNRADTAHRAIVRMRTNLDEMIVGGLLEVSLSSFSDLQDRDAKEAAADLASALNEAARYIRYPEIGLRTDLPLFSSADDF